MLLMNPATVCCHKASFPFLPFSKTFAVSTSSFCPPVCQSLLSWRIHSISRIVNPNSNKFRVKCSSHEPLKVIISRDPSSGEDSLCRKIANKYELVHISTEDLLKDEVFLGTDIGIKVKECMEKGLSIPNNLIREVVTSRTSKQDTKEKGWLLVGHPENSSLEQRPDIYILLDVESGQEMYRPDNDVQDSYLDVLYKIDEDRSTEELFREIDSLLLQVQTNKLKTTKFQRKVVPAFNSASRSQDSNWRGIPTLLNNVPHSRDIRKYFYDDILQSTQRALEAGMIRLKVENNIPELNPEMDVYRIGTLMELVRSLALSFADDGKRVKVCVQGYMGDGALAGMPLQLAGSRKILEFMDWGNYGAKGTFINIGSIGARDVTDEDDIFILVAPQNAVGNCIIDDLQAMTNAARNRPVILVNPRLKDLPSSNGIMQAMGREKRLEYAASFQECYFFRLLYYAGTQYPIMGALRMSYPYPYELFKRVDDPSVKEKYVLLSTFSEKPTPSEINDAFEGRTRTKSERKTSIWSFLSGIL